jgi:3-methyladenine DNA glycosylase AlkD
MKNAFHKDLLSLIVKNSGKPTRHTFLNSYLGNDHLRYPINNPTMRIIARDWMRAHKDLGPDAFADLLTSLIEGESCTEKMMAGFIMGYSTKAQRNVDPAIFDEWLDHLVGWVEVDTLCTGDFVRTQLPLQWTKWKKLVLKLSKDPNINKRRASLVLFCSVLGRIEDEAIADTAFTIIERLKGEKEVIITKAISWVLRTMIKHYRERVSDYLWENSESLPKIAVRETRMKLDTGTKNVRRQS